MHPVVRITEFWSQYGLCPVAYLVRNSSQAFDRILGRADWNPET